MNNFKLQGKMDTVFHVVNNVEMTRTDKEKLQELLRNCNRLISYINELQEQKTMRYSFWVESKRQDEKQLTQYEVLQNVIDELRTIINY